MNSGTGASHYAQALMAIAADAGRTDLYLSQLKSFAELWLQSSDLRIALTHPNIAKEQKHAVLNAVVGGYDHTFANFLRLLTDRGKMSLVPKIAESFVLLSDEAKGIERVIVYTATPLKPHQREALHRALTEQLKAQVSISERIQPSLIGGIRVEASSKVYDSTVKRHLERLKEQMRGL